ncbi:MAG TPA: hypothetical protein VF733_04840 [Candidatus Saccharimonadales bacterium]
MSTNSSGKDTIYIDIDDEITAIIDKVRGSHEKIVALVLPKRATVLQSVVNMRLLKRTADEAKKHLVLITAEAGLLPLAGSVGIYVAKSLQSRPEIPTVHMGDQDSGDDTEETVHMTDDEPIDKSKSVGQHLRRTPASAAVPLASERDDEIELDNTSAASVAAATSSKKPKKPGKKFSIPDFDKFRLWGVVGVLAVIIFVFLWYMMFVSMPRASISVKTDSSAIQANLDVTLSPTAKEVDAEEAVIPSVEQKLQKTFTQQVDSTGQKDNGTKASGTIRFVYCNLNDVITGNTVTIPAGTGVSANGLTFITQSTVVVEPSNYQGNTCKNNKKSTPVGITSQGAGEKYNMAASNYSVAGFANVTGEGSATSGGTSQIVKIVSQTDIDNAKQKIATQDANPIKLELQRGLTAKNLYSLEDTFKTSEPEVTTNVKVGDEAPSVTVTQKITYSMIGAKLTDLKKIVEHEVEKKIDKNKQQIIDFGLEDATFKLLNERNGSTMVVMDATAVAGSDLNVGEIKNQVAGKKGNDAKEIIGKYPGVTEVEVDYSPFWVKAIPKKTSKITITVEKPVVKKDAN